MSLVSGRILTACIVAQLLLLCLKSIDATDYTQFITQSPEDQVCGYQMKCAPKHICINGSIATGGDYSIGIRMECPHGQICCRVTPEDDSVEENLPTSDGCGYLNQGGLSLKPREIPDQSEFGEFPWMLTILSNDQERKFYGGGSLIHPKIALTAAHIVHNKFARNLVVRAGEWTIQGRVEMLPHQDREVLELIVHEQYDRNTMFNDIALLFLRDAFELKAHINTICLPPTQSTPQTADCFATGWGLSTKNKVNSDYLKKIRLSVVSNRRCQQQLRRTQLGYFFHLHNSFMCAEGIQGIDTCLGDGGSPLVCPIPGKEGRYYQVGVVSWCLDNNCKMDNAPGVYANIAHLRNWVYKTVIGKRFDIKTFTAS